jgi:hypothetical protein
MFIRIIKRPAGEAPEWVRDAWIGLLIPTGQTEPRTFAAFGVLSIPKGLWAEWWTMLRGRALRVEGYTVSAVEAVRILSEKDPRAADWWRENCPALLEGRGGGLTFQTHECELIAKDSG